MTPFAVRFTKLALAASTAAATAMIIEACCSLRNLCVFTAFIVAVSIALVKVMLFEV